VGELDIKKLEFDYFKKINLEGTLIFGGTLGQSAGGITAF